MRTEGICTNKWDISSFDIAAPDPPSNLSVNVRSGKTAQVSWSPPLLGHYSSFKLKVKHLCYALMYLQYGNWSLLSSLWYFEIFTVIYWEG
jgi:hypothetical protein